MNIKRTAQEKGFRLNKPKGIAAADLVSTGSDARLFASRQTALQPFTQSSDRRDKPAQKTLGFTLLEMMIAIGVVAILASIALPAYNDFVARTKLRSGTESLSAFRSVLEQAYQDNRSYRTDDDSACLIASYASEHFTVTCAATSDLLYVLTASSTADSGLGSAGDYVFTVDQDGIQKTTSYAGESVDIDHWLYQVSD